MKFRINPTSALLLIAAALSITGRAYSQPQSSTARPVLPYRESILPAGILKSSHSPSIVELPNGDLFAVWYAPVSEGYRAVIWASRRPAGADKWTVPVIINKTPGYSNKNPVLYLGRDNKLWLFWSDETRKFKVVIDRLRAKTSLDSGRSWTETRSLGVPDGFLTRTHPITLRDGKIVLPIYSDWNTSSAVTVSSDGGASWGKPRYLLYLLGIQPTVIERSDGSLFALTRSGMWPRLSWQAVSKDSGMHWSGQKTSNVKNPGCSLEMIRLKSGHVVIVFNDSKKERSNLNMALSRDEGRTWAASKVIDFIDGSTNIYPSVMQSRDGLIHVLYARDNRSSIAHFVTDEKWISAPEARSH